MYDTLFLFLPVPLFFLLGLLLGRIGVIDDNAVSFLFRFVSLVSLPALTLSVFPYIALSSGMILLPLVALAVSACMLACSATAASLLHLGEPARAAFTMGIVAAHTGFVLPFVKPFFGNEGVAAFLLFHGGSLLSAVALTRFARQKQVFSASATQHEAADKAMLWSLACGLAMNIADFRFEPVVAVALHDIAQLAIPLLLLASGASLRVPPADRKTLFSGFVIRLAVGAAAGYAAAAVCGLQEMENSVAIFCAAAPAGMLRSPALRMEHSAMDFSTALASATMIGCLLLLPILLLAL